MSRSIFGLIYTYNCLPQIVVDSASISITQRHLHRALICVAESSVFNWQTLFTRGIRNLTVAKLRSHVCTRPDATEIFFFYTGDSRLD